MDPISKTNMRKPGERDDRLFQTTPDYYTALAIVALPIIMGLEIYYQSQCNDPGTLGGFWTALFIVLWVSAVIVRRQQARRFGGVFKQQGRYVEETIQFSDEAFEVAINGYFSHRYPWTSLFSFRDAKKYMRFTLAGIGFKIPKRFFSQEEVDQIIALLKAKMQPNKHPWSNTEATKGATSPSPKARRWARLLLIIAILPFVTYALIFVIGTLSDILRGNSADKRIAECNLEALETQVLSTDGFIVAIQDCFWKEETRTSFSFDPPQKLTGKVDVLVVDLIIVNRLSQQLQFDCDLFDAGGRRLRNEASSELPFNPILSPDEAKFGTMEFTGFSNKGQRLELRCNGSAREDNPSDEVVLQIQ